MAIKTKNCKVCGKEVTPSAKVCPSCGRKSKMGFGKKTLIGLGALVVLRIIKSASEGGGDSTPKTASPSPSLTSSSLVLTEIAAGVPTIEVTTANLNIKLFEVTVPHYTDRDPVKDYPHGSWVVAKLCIQNKHEDAINVTSTNFKLQDKDKRQFTILIGETVGLKITRKATSFLTVKPGNTTEGQLAYDVPKKLNRFTLEDSECVTGTPIKLSRQ